MSTGMEARSLFPRWFLLPALGIYLVFYAAPTLASFVLSFTDWNAYLDRLSFVGLENFRKAFDDRVVGLSVRNTFVFALVTTVGKNLVGLSLALLLNRRLATRSLAPALFFAPAVLSYIVIGLVFRSILHPTGLLNQALAAAGLGFLAQQWLVDANIVMYSIAAVEIWQWSGYHMTIYLAGLKGIPRDLYESAYIDGAGPWQRLRAVTLPLVMPAFNVSLVLSLIGGMKVFTQVFILTEGGPGNASQVMYTYVYEAFADGRWALGNAVNLSLFVIIAVLALTVLAVARRGETEL
jgi:raffinose/stachyose/melibiose transport system permease protein